LKKPADLLLTVKERADIRPRTPGPPKAFYLTTSRPLIFGDVILFVATSGVPRGGVWGFQPPPRNSEGPPKSCQTQPDM